jgi:hypothetical protein
MINSEKKVRDLAQKLNDSNQSKVIAAIESLRKETAFSGAVHLLADLHDSTPESVVKDTIRNFMNDVKDLSVRPEVIAEISGSHKPDTVAMLASSCWQSGLDYSDWSSELAIVFCRSDYATAIECFTVIEESAHSLPAGKKKEIISILNENTSSEYPEKMALHRELISILS